MVFKLDLIYSLINNDYFKQQNNTFVQKMHLTLIDVNIFYVFLRLLISSH